MLSSVAHRQRGIFHTRDNVRNFGDYWNVLRRTYCILDWMQEVKEGENEVVTFASRVIS
jgi:hypothetical protein